VPEVDKVADLDCIDFGSVVEVVPVAVLGSVVEILLGILLELGAGPAFGLVIMQLFQSRTLV